MYLKRLELQGFKSFADKTVLEFIPGITTVIGPNGSGKSNISDSIRWVLGEQSIKSLRGSKSEDIIFAGTESRKSLGFAEASVVIDNTDGELPIEFSEVVITRRIYRSGETGYFINKASCRLKDILELLMDTGIGRDGYSIIGQGKIDEILSNKSEDRRHIFEEAAGIVKYRVRKLEAEKKVEQTKLNLLRINDILSEIEANIEPLKEQSDKAKKFLSLREELKTIEIGLFIYNIENYKVKIEELTKDIEGITSHKKDEDARLSVLQNLKENLKEELEEITTKIEEKQNLGLETEKRQEQINSQINIAKEKITNNKKNYDRFLKEIEELEKRNKGLKEEITAKLEKKDKLSNDREKFAKELEEKQNELNELVKKLSNEELKIEEKKKQIEENSEKKYEKKELISVAESNKENLYKREKAVKNEISDTISELDKKRLIKSEIYKEFSEKENESKKYNERLETIYAKKNESDKKLKEYDEIINQLSDELRVKTSKQRFLSDMEKEKEGYSRAVKSILLECEKQANLNQGVEGVLANLITVQKEYQIAIEMSLGGVLQNIVTENEETAKKLIEFLRTNSLGRAAFLPITSVKGKKLDKLITNGLKGVIGIAANLVKTNKKYEGIIMNLLGRTVVVDNMDTAIILAKQNSYSFKIVTLKGDIITTNGAISGGSVVQKGHNIIGRTAEIKELEKEMLELNKKIDEIKLEKEKYEETIENILDELNALERLNQEIEIAYATEKQRMLSLEESITKLEEKLQSLKTESAEIEKEKQANEETVKESEQEILKLESLSEELKHQVDEFASKNKENQKAIDDLNFEVTNLKISLTSFDESSNSMEEIMERINNEFKNNEESINNKKEQREQIVTNNKELEESIEKSKQEIERIKQEVLDSSDEVEKLKQDKINKNEAINRNDREISERYETIEELKNQISKLELRKSRNEIELEQIVNKMWEDYELTPNNVGEYKKLTNVQETSRKVKDLRDEIKNLGSININAIEEYKQTKERYDFMCEQRLDLENSISKLKNVVLDMTKIMKEQFEKQFKIINRNFGEVFRELFGGGRAELTLTDEQNILESGIEIAVQPPGKKLQSMSLLSGGERALTAIALLFAILKINPAPFCVLDEIEAALDDVNVYRFADYLKKFAKETQFLVITHRKGTMEAADTVYGITMEEKGISKLLSMKLK